MRGMEYEGRRQTVLSSWCGPSSRIVEVVSTSCSNFGAKLEGGRRRRGLIESNSQNVSLYK